MPEEPLTLLLFLVSLCFAFSLVRMQVALQELPWPLRHAAHGHGYGMTWGRSLYFNKLFPGASGRKNKVPYTRHLVYGALGMGTSRVTGALESVAWLRVLAVRPAGCVALNELLNRSVTQFPRLYSGGISNTYSIG